MTYVASWSTKLTSANTPDASESSNNTNTPKSMAVKSIELVQNISLGDKSLNSSVIDTYMSKSNGKTLVKTRGFGAIRENGRDFSLFTDFMPLPETETLKNGRNNRVVVIFHYEDGTSKTLNRVETVKFWNEVLGVEDSVSTRFKIVANFDNKVYNKEMILTGLKNHRFQSIRVVLNDVNNMFTFSITEYDGKDSLTLRPNSADVNLNAHVVELGSQTIGFKLNGDFFVEETEVKPDFSSCSKSSKRREGRKQASAARAGLCGGRKSVADKAGETPAPAETPGVTSATTSAVDTEKEALRRENAELKAEVAGLKTELANTNAKLDQILAMMSAQAQPAALVAEPTPEPEVVEEPAVEETVEEEVPEEPVQRNGGRLKGRAAFFAAAQAAKAAKAEAAAEDDGDFFNFNDEE